MAKAPGKALRTGAACAPFRDHLAGLRAGTPPPSSWTSVEAGFVQAMMAFDDEVIAGRATDGERQNGKGDYFNDLLAMVLENASGAPLNRRSGVPGLIFPNHSLDVTYPEPVAGAADQTIVEVMVEAKMLGTPQHPGNAQTQVPEGRPGAADLLKRCKEAGFKSIDLKAAYGMLQAAHGIEQQEGIGGDLTSWLRTARPRSYMAIAVRATSPADARAIITMADNMTRVMDGVGLFIYRPVRFLSSSLSPARYEAMQVPPTLELVRVLQRITVDLRHAAQRPTTLLPPPPSVAGQEALDSLDEETT